MKLTSVRVTHGVPRRADDAVDGLTHAADVDGQVAAVGLGKVHRDVAGHEGEGEQRLAGALHPGTNKSRNMSREVQQQPLT